MSLLLVGDARLPQRFWAKVRINAETGCWEWVALVDHNGYGRFRVPAPQSRFAHRVSYTALVGPVPEGLEIDHLCRVRHCVNPAHLEAVTRSVNVRRGVAAEGARRLAAARTHCPRGHEYAGDNLYVTASGHRSCNECRRARQRRPDPTPRGTHNAVKTHCPHGHAYTEENTYFTSRGGRACATCRRTRAKAG